MCTDVQSWFIDAQRDETDLAGGQNFTRITADIHIILLEIFCGNKSRIGAAIEHLVSIFSGALTPVN